MSRRDMKFIFMMFGIVVTLVLAVYIGVMTEMWNDASIFWFIVTTVQFIGTWHFVHFEGKD